MIPGELAMRLEGDLTARLKDSLKARLKGRCGGLKNTGGAGGTEGEMKVGLMCDWGAKGEMRVGLMCDLDD